MRVSVCGCVSMRVCMFICVYLYVRLRGCMWVCMYVRVRDRMPESRPFRVISVLRLCSARANVSSASR